MTTLYRFDNKIIRTPGGGLAKSADCCCGSTITCLDCTLPDEVILTLPNCFQAHVPVGCEECPTLIEGPIAVQWFGIVFSKCRWWTSCIPKTCTAGGNLWMEHIVTVLISASDIVITATQHLSVNECVTSQNFIIWEKTISTETPCDELQGVIALPFSSSWRSASYNLCDAPATCSDATVEF